MSDRSLRRSLAWAAVIIAAIAAACSGSAGPEARDPGRSNAGARRLLDPLSSRLQKDGASSSVRVLYEDDWFGGVTLLGVDEARGRALIKLESQSPARLAFDVVDVTGTAGAPRLDRWEATGDRATTAVQGASFAPLTGSFTEDASRFAGLLRDMGPWHMRAAIPSPTFAVADRGGAVLYGAPSADGTNSDWLFALGSEQRRFDVGLMASYSPVFSPDGTSVAFRGCASSPCDYGLFVGRWSALGGAGSGARIGSDRPRRATGVQQSTPPVWNAGGDSVLAVGARGAERCLFRVPVDVVLQSRSLACVKGLSDVSFTQDPVGRTGVIAGVHGDPGSQSAEVSWVLVADGAVLSRHTVERAVGGSALSSSGLLAMPMQLGAVGLVDLVSGKRALVPSTEGWFFGFEGARWIGDRLVLLRKIEGKKGFQVVSIDASELTRPSQLSKPLD